MERYTYLSNPTILNYIDNLRQKTEFVRIIILNREDLPLRTIEGQVTAGSININADSAVRRTGNLTFITDLSDNISNPLDIMNQITDIDTLISINKRVEIEVGIKNTGFKYADYQIFWIPLGVYIISNASVTYNNNGILISLKLSDKMALLNGEEGGIIPAEVQLSPYSNILNNTVTTEPILVYDLIKTLLLSFSDLLEEQILITDIPKETPQPVIWSPIDKEIYVYKDSEFSEEAGSGIIFQELPKTEDIYEFIEKNTHKFENQSLQASSYWFLPRFPQWEGESVSFNFNFKTIIKGVEENYTSLTFNGAEGSRYSLQYGRKEVFNNEEKINNKTVWTDDEGWIGLTTENRVLFVDKQENIPLDLLEWLHMNAIGDYHILLWNTSPLDFKFFPSNNGYVPEGIKAENFVHKKVIKNNENYYDYYAQYGIEIDTDNNTIKYIESSKDAYVKIINGDIQLTTKTSLDNEKGVVYIAPGARTGYLTVPFVYPEGMTLSAQAGDTVVTVLDKIKSTLGGNFEYFFDVNGIFHFQKIKNYLNEGSSINDLTKAINEKYFITTNKGRAVYNFKDANLISSYSNNPQYTQIKNDFNIYGQHPETKQPIRYHLLLQRLPTSEEMRYWRVEFIKDENSKIISAKSAEKYNSIADIPSLLMELINKDENIKILELDYNDWRLKYYFDAVRKINNNERLTDFDQELISNIPLIIDFETGNLKGEPQTLQYYLDAVDTNSVELMDQVLIRDFGIESIGRRTKVINDNNLNCMFTTPTPEAYLDNADNNVKAQISLISSTENSLYDALRSVIHQHLSYNNNINITSLPVYRLDANMRISVNNDESDIHGDYIIKSISLPLGVTGNMTINAQKAVERI